MNDTGARGGSAPAGKGRLLGERGRQRLTEASRDRPRALLPLRWGADDVETSA